MTTPHPRRPLLKRAAVWTAAVALLIAGYPAGMPFAYFFVIKYASALEPAGRVIYAPVIDAVKNDLPGSKAYEWYCLWCLDALGVNVG